MIMKALTWDISDAIPGQNYSASLNATRSPVVMADLGLWRHAAAERQQKKNKKNTEAA